MTRGHRAPSALWRQFPIVETALLLLSVGACFALTAGLIG